MSFTGGPSLEFDRVALLRATRLRDASYTAAFDALTRLTQTLTGCAHVSINLVEEDHLWSLSGLGLAHRTAPRASSLCNQTLLLAQPLAIDDASLDTRFAQLAQGQSIKAYLGLPLTVEGHVLAVLCAYDPRPRTWPAALVQQLIDVAIGASALMDAQLQAQRWRLNEARVRTASLAGSDWLWETDKDGIVRWISPGLALHTGVDPSEVLGKPATEGMVQRDDDTRASWVDYLKRRQQREPFCDVIADRLTPRGLITVSISGTPVFSSRGEFKGYRGATRNITRQFNAEREARRADHLLRRAIESFQIGVMITDAQGQVLLINQPWRDQMGGLYEAHQQHWPSVLRAMIDRGDHPDAQPDPEAYLRWRLGLTAVDIPQETRWQDRWLLVKDHALPDGCAVHFAMDITKAKCDAALLIEQQAVLSAARARLSTVLSALPDLWFVIDAQDRVIDAQEGHPMLVRPLSELRGRPVGTGLPPAQAQAQCETIHKVRATGQPHDLTYRLTTRDGKRRKFEARMTPMPEGHILFLARDITEADRAAQELRVSEELYRSVASAISDGLLILELDGRVVALNPAASRILGIPPEAVHDLQRPSLLGLVLLSDDLQTPLPISQWPTTRTLTQGTRIVDEVHPLRRPDGQVIWLQVSCHLLRVSPQSQPFAAMATLRDITQERQAQQALQRSEERWLFALEGAGDGVWDWDLARNHLFLSPRWKGMLGYEDAALSDTLDDLFRLVHPDDRDLVARTMTSYRTLAADVLQGEFRMRHRDGCYLHILSRGKVVSRDAAGAPLRIVGTHSDISPIKQAELALREKQTAEAANAAKTEFLSRMSHEIRTPLNAINGFAQLLNMQLLQSGDQQAGQGSYVTQILHASQHLMGLVNDVLDLQQVEAGVLKFKAEPLPLADEVSQCLAMLTPMANAAQVRLVDCVEGPWHVVADRQRLRQVIMNIGSNAIKYNRPGGTVRLSIDAQQRRGLSLVVEDNGEGMGEAQLARLFQPFERLGRETSSIEGTGLGLIITRSLIEAMGGHMDIRSQPGAGTRVHITLPRVGETTHAPAEHLPDAPPPERQRTMSMPLPLPRVQSLSPLRVLYVEDNRINAMLFEEALRPYAQVALSVAEDGPTALEMAREFQPDVLVLDAHLPGMSGFEVLQALRALPALALVPAYMCSADAMPDDLARAQAAGFVGYWTKPIDIVQVTTELCRLADSRDNAAHERQT